MAATVSPAEESHDKPRRIRRAHNKTRAGCITCKIRKKKCDEAKPACMRCTSTGRRCDGYISSTQQPQSSRTSHSPLDDNFIARSSPSTIDLSTRKVPEYLSRKPSRHMTLCRGPTLIPFGSDVEKDCFHYFRLHTGPQFASYFDSAIWRTFVLQAAMVHPAVLRAAAAVGAVHRRFTLGITREAFEYCAIAQNLHNKAMRSLKEEQMRPGSYTREVTLMASMLHGLFECFQANFGVAVQHLTSALRAIMNRPMRVTYSETHYCKIQPRPSIFSTLFKRLHLRAHQLFGSKPRILARQRFGEVLPDIPTTFESLEQGCDLIFTEIDWILHAPAQSWLSKDERAKAQSLHVTRMLRWSMSYAETLQQQTYTTSIEKKCRMLLKLARNAGYLMLYLLIYLEGKDELPRLPDIAQSLKENDLAQREMENLTMDLPATPPISMMNHHLFRITKDTSAFAPSPAQVDTLCSDELEQLDPDLDIATRLLWNAVQHREELNTNLARVCVLAESVINENDAFAYDEHSVSLDSGIGPPRFPDPSPNSSAKTRHLVKTALMRHDADEEMWKMLGVYGVAERISSIEEHAVVAVVKDFIPPAKYEPKWVDVTYFMDKNKVLIRYCRMDDEGTGMLWTQEWLAF